MVVYKYELEPVTALELPIHAHVLTAQMQNDRLVVWVLINEQQPIKESRYFVALNTGAPIEWTGRLRYINTATSTNGIVWHVFERLP